MLERRALDVRDDPAYLQANLVGKGAMFRGFGLLGFLGLNRRRSRIEDLLNPVLDEQERGGPPDLLPGPLPDRDKDYQLIRLPDPVVAMNMNEPAAPASGRPSIDEIVQRVGALS